MTTFAAAEFYVPYAKPWNTNNILMRYYQLGNSDLVVSDISLGCMSLGESHRENARIIHKACDEGINFFDTADLYAHGDNEKTVGKALQDRRQSVIIATKVGNKWRPDGAGWDWVPRKNHIKKAVFDSLRRLRTHYIDLYQLHGGTIEDPIDEVIEAFEELKTAGHIRYYGISSIRPNVIREYVTKSNITSVMMQYSLLDRRPEESCMSILKENQVGMIVRGSLAKGLLAGKPVKAYLNHDTSDVQTAIQKLESVKLEASTLGQTALKFVTAHPAVSTVSVGASKAEQITEAAQASKLPDLDGAILDALRTAVPSHFYQKHR
jgi:aryl-alcohol dehydrogenase-like predicted oxidoreductase